MTRDEFRIGVVFFCGSVEPWICTDVGTRVVVAVQARELPSGPPYEIAEFVFDEYDLEACSLHAPPEVDEPVPDDPGELPNGWR